MASFRLRPPYEVDSHCLKVEAADRDDDKQRQRSAQAKGAPMDGTMAEGRTVR